MTVTLGVGAVATAGVVAVKAAASTATVATSLLPAATSTAATVATAVAPMAASTTAATVAATVGLAVLGADETGTTFDCWKPVLHDTSTEPSSGKILKEVIEDPRISRVILQDDQDDEHLPNLSLVNIWGEKFDIQYIMFQSGRLYVHALRNDSV